MFAGITPFLASLTSAASTGLANWLELGSESTSGSLRFLFNERRGLLAGGDAELEAIIKSRSPHFTERGMNLHMRNCTTNQLKHVSSCSIGFIRTRFPVSSFKIEHSATPRALF